MKTVFEELKEWMPEILGAIKKDLKNDHLAVDPGFYRQHFGNRPLNRLSPEEIFTVYEKVLLEGDEDMAEFVVNRWVFKHGDLYQHFAEKLSAIDPDFEKINTLTDAQVASVLQGTQSFGAVETFLFAALNRVAFPKVVLESLQEDAKQAKIEQAKEQVTSADKETLEKLKAAHQREVARLQDKVEGVLKKYTKDVEALKKQIRALQKKA